MPRRLPKKERFPLVVGVKLMGAHSAIVDLMSAHSAIVDFVIAHSAIVGL